MKKFQSSKIALINMLFWSVLFCAVALLALGLEIFGFLEEKGAGYFAFVVFGSLSVFFLWYLNRSACVICLEDRIIKRKGLIGGFYKECPVDAIQHVVIRHARREGNFIYLVDGSAHQFDRIRKDSYISFRKTKENLEFVQTFWSGVVEK